MLMVLLTWVLVVGQDELGSCCGLRIQRCRYTDIGAVSLSQWIWTVDIEERGKHSSFFVYEISGKYTTFVDQVIKDNVTANSAIRLSDYTERKYRHLKNVADHSVAYRITHAAFWILADYVTERKSKTVTTCGSEALTIPGGFPGWDMLIGFRSVLYSLFASVRMINRKDLRTAYITMSMFCVLWIGGESAPELGTDAQEVSGWL